MNKILIKMYYQLGLYKDKDLAVFVKSGDITEDEMKEISSSNTHASGNDGR